MKWEYAEDEHCPNCGQLLQFQYRQDSEHGDVVAAERCPKCRWITRFPQDAEHYTTVY